MTFAVVAYLFFSFTSQVFAETPNPFMKGNKPSNVNPAAQQISGNMFGDAGSKFYKELITFQRNFNHKITSSLANYRKDKNPDILFYIWGIAVIYGFVHALMPGHGKNIILGWIMASQRRLYKVLATAIAGMIMHVFSSIVVVYTIWLLIGGRISSQSSEFAKYISYIAFAIISWLALKQLYQAIVKRKKGHHHHGKQLDSIQDETSWKECMITAFGIGLVPCPVSTVLIVFMVSQGLHVEGLLTGLAFAIGMGVALLLFSTVVWTLRHLLQSRNNNNLMFRILDFGLQVTGSILMFFSGWILITPYI